MSEAHGVGSSTPVSAEDARHVARVMAALATPSRVRILAHLRAGAADPPRAPTIDITPATRSTMTDEHSHDAPHAHEHSHGGETHVHAHTSHDHGHVEHEHEH